MVNVLGECHKGVFRNSCIPQQLDTPSPSQIPNPTPPKSFKVPVPKRTYSVDSDEFAITYDQLPDFESFKYMTLEEAAKQHKMFDKAGNPVGDKRTAYKCFEAYAKLNQIKAKYYKAYYISKGYDESDLSDVERERIVAQLFKEVADDDANEFPEAKLRYGHCLYHGKGVELNFSEALKYFEKAAEDDLKVAMYNVGNLYYRGCDGKKDEQKAIHYMKLAAYNEYPPAIQFCKDHQIQL